MLGVNDVLRRRVAADVLGQLGGSDPIVAERVLPLLLDRAQAEDVDEVVTSVVTALSHLGDPRAARSLLRWRTSANADVRRAVAAGLPFVLDDDDPQSDVIAALIQLSADEDGGVRDFATFAVGELSREVDTPQIRAALWARIDDPHVDTRFEAMVGLAVRHDEGVVDWVARELAATNVYRLAVRAAAELGEPRLLPLLADLRRWWDIDEELLTQAIAACGGRPERE